MLVMIFLLMLSSPLAADTSLSEPALNLDPYEILGQRPAESFDLLGSPAEVYTYRNARPEEDNVVFYFKNHIYLFFFQNRVWQVRADFRFEGNIYGLTMGSGIEKAEEILGPPFSIVENSRIYSLPYKAYPVRARLIFKDNILTDLYIYRSDY